ncbi:MAG: nicotinamide mononucleotide transporter [Bacteroidetes bacterium]|nr:nicotinamide mononucleotide transporter [Bacteroidota bacterium]
MLGWLLSNKVELLGAILGILYIFFSIQQNILTWPTGLVTSALYIVIFLNSKLYADMGLQVYYVIISIYGWYFWIKGKKSETNKAVQVRRVSKSLWFKLSTICIGIYFIILFILKFTDSDIAALDALTTALSIVATWMLAKKYLEHWLIWIFVDLLSSGMYVYKNLWPTVILFLVYTFMAYFGYVEWKKDFKSQH